MREITKTKYLAAKAAIEKGATIAQAIKAQKMSTNSYSKLARLEKKSPRKTYTRGAPKFIDLPHLTPTKSSKVFVVVCDSADLRTVIGGLV